MRVFGAVLALMGLVSGHAAAQAACAGHGLEVSRIVEIDTSGAPLFGDITKSAKEESFLKPKEVVLTFDDGPLPWVTRSVLDTLDRYCAKATFFSVGQMAIEYPAMVREVLARGHTLGAHTWSHQSLPRLPLAKAKDEIERGFAAVAMAAGQPIAPFFRFPGLGDSSPLLAYLQQRGIATFTVDIVSNDSFIGDPVRLARHTLGRVEARQGGILLFHDIKPVTAKALSIILSELAARGYKVVHLRAKEPVTPLADYNAELIPLLVKAERAGGAKSAPAPIIGNPGPDVLAPPPPVTVIAPPPRPRPVQSAQAGHTGHRNEATATARAPGEPALKDPADPWSTRIRQPKKTAGE